MTWKQLFQIIAAVAVVALFVAMLQGCKTVDCLPEVIYRDSIRTEYRHDSIYRYERDSIFIRQTPDTVWVEKFVTRYRDVLKVQTDTVTLTQEVEKVREVEVIKEVPRKRSGYDKFCSGFFWSALVLALLLALWKLADHVPALKSIKQVVKTLFNGWRFLKS